MSETIQTDADIAYAAQMKPVLEIAADLGIPQDVLESYGRYKAKIHLGRLEAWRQEAGQAQPVRGKLVLVTAINPTPSGEGKTTVLLGLGDALRRKGERAVVAMREPSMGPVFGVKGGAAGGGYAQVVPMEEINLHFTGDMHAIGAANNLLAALIDNHIFQGNSLKINPARVFWRRVVDMNDRQLRQCVTGLGERSDGVARQDGFDITVASEVMAIFCLVETLEELKERLGEIVIGESYDGNVIYAKDLEAHGAMAALLRDALHPNLVQTLEHTPVLVHGGPFANIAHGCNSLIATKLALETSDFTVTEAGFGADLGAEKFCDIVCREGDLRPDAVVLVATIRALKYNGGQRKKFLGTENLDALRSGSGNLVKHLENLRNEFGLPVVVALNRFATDTPAEIELMQSICAVNGADCSLVEVWAHGGEGALDLAEKVIALTQSPNNFSYLYQESDSCEEKITAIATRLYGAASVEFSRKARSALKWLRSNNFDKLPVCMAKTQYSLSDDKSLLGRPRDFVLHVEDLTLSHGAGFIVVLCGSIIKMPGLPREPASTGIDVDGSGRITGLF